MAYFRPRLPHELKFATDSSTSRRSTATTVILPWFMEKHRAVVDYSVRK